MFSRLFAFMVSQIAALQQSLEGALAIKGASAFGTGVILILFWCWAAWKLLHSWSSTAEDTFPRKLHSMFTETGRGTVVYVLVLAAPVLVGTIGGVSKAYARRATTTMISAATPVFKDVDSVIEDTKPLFGTLAPMLMVNAGGQDLTRRSLWRGYMDASGGDPNALVAGMVLPKEEQLSDSERQLLSTGNQAQSAAINAFRKGVAAQDAMVDAAKKTGNKSRIEKALADRQTYLNEAKAALKGANDAGASIYTSYEAWREKRKQEVWATTQARWFNEYQAAKSGGQKTYGAGIWENFSEGTDAPVERKKHLDAITNQAVESALQAEEDHEREAKGWMDDVPRWAWWIIGIVGALICAIGAIAMGIQVFKGVYGTLIHCVGFLAIVTFAVALATPLSPAFMLCFLGQKTEPYGRNFINFMLSMVFAGMALALMVGAIGFLLQNLSTSMVSLAATDLLRVQTSTDDIGGFFFACLCFAGTLTVFGMTITLVSDWAKKGIAVGTGLFSGHFPA